MKDGLKAEREEHQLFDVTMERELEKSLPEQQARPLSATKRGSDSASLTSLCPIASVCPIYYEYWYSLVKSATYPWLK